MKEINISINKQGKWDVKVTGGIKFEEALHMCINGIYSLANAFVKAAPKEQQTDMRGRVYDTLNLSFSNFLDTFQPQQDRQFDEAVLQIAQHTARDLMDRSVQEKRPFKDILDEEYPNVRAMS